MSVLLAWIAGSSIVSAQSGTGLVRHAPQVGGKVEGSLQQVLPESLTLSGGAVITGDLLLPGTPTVRLNGKPDYGGTLDGRGAATPSNHQVTLNGSVSLRHVVRRTDPPAVAAVAPPPVPGGTRDVIVGAAGESIGDFATLRNLTLRSGAGQVAIPPGTYGTFNAGPGSGFTLGRAGDSQPAVYHLQQLSFSGPADVRVAGPVMLVLGAELSTGGVIGGPGEARRLKLQVARGGVTLKGGAAVYADLLVPDGTVTLEGDSQLTGGLAADRLVVQGSARLRLIAPDTANRPPVVAFTAPVSGASFAAPAAITLAASASDPDGTVAKVEFFSGTTWLGEDRVAPYELAVGGLMAGAYTFFARATDQLGTGADAVPVSIVVTNPNQPPTVTLSAPAEGAGYTAPADLRMAALAADPDGTIVRVEFLRDGTVVGEDQAAPFEYSLSGVAAGTYVLSARAWDNQRAFAVSAPVTVTVLNPNQPPTVALIAPPSPAAFAAPATFVLAAVASDPDGTIARVEFFRDGLRIGEDTAGPYEFTVNGLAAGSYHFVARAYDNQDSATDSAPVRVTVSLPNQPPVVTLTAPAAGASVASFAPLTFSAIATDPDGTIAQVEFLAGAVRLGSGTVSAPGVYGYTHAAGLPPGSATVVARATDNAGATTTSAPVSINILATLPYLADFEPGEGYAPGALAGQLGWQVGAGTAAIVDDVWFSGAHSVRLFPGTPLTQIVQTFAPLAGEPVVFVDFVARPVADPEIGGATRLEVEGARFALRRNVALGELWVWSETGTGTGDWTATGFSAALNSDGVPGQWLRFTVRLDFSQRRWDLFANGGLVAADLALPATARTFLGALSVRGHGAAASGFDYLLAGPASPLFADADRDGLDDAWELRHGLNPAVDDRAGDPDGDGRTNVQEFLQGSDPNDYYNGVLPGITSLVGSDQRPAADGAIRVQVTGPGGNMLANAPVNFEALAGGLRLAAAPNAATPVTSLTTRTNVAGVATVYVIYPASPAAVSTVLVSAGSGIQVRSLTLTLLPPIIDDDGDGLDDRWEVTHLGTLEHRAGDDPGQVGRTLLQSQQQALSPWPPPPVGEGLQLWLRSDLGLVTDAASRVSGWTDLSGRGVHLASGAAGAQPLRVPMVFGVKPVVRFEGAATALRSAAVDLLKGSADFTLFVVAAPAATQATSATILDHDHLASPPGGFVLHQDGGALNHYAVGWRDVATGSWQGGAATAALSPGERQMVAVVKAGHTQSAFVDGTARYTLGVAADLLAAPPRVLTLGAAGGPDRGWRGDLAEVLLYHRALSAAERATVESALRARYTDADGNGLPDTWELSHFGRTGVDPSADPDADGLSHRREFELGSSPVRADTDGDGLPDGWEASHGTDLLRADSNLDVDGDGLTALAEFLLGGDPRRAAIRDASGLIQLRVYRPRQ